MRKIVKNLLEYLGLQISRVDSTIVIPKLHPGPKTFRCGGIDWNEDGIDAFLAGPILEYKNEYNSFPAHKSGSDVKEYYFDNPFLGFAMLRYVGK
jgi:hypothetical protein